MQCAGANSSRSRPACLFVRTIVLKGQGRARLQDGLQEQDVDEHGRLEDAPEHVELVVDHACVDLVEDLQVLGR